MVGEVYIVLCKYVLLVLMEIWPIREDRILREVCLFVSRLEIPRVEVSTGIKEIV